MTARSVTMLVVWAFMLLAGPVWAQAEGEAGRSPIAIAAIAVGAALAVGLTALGTALAQGRIGAAGAGTIAEKPEMTGTIILLVAIPETMVILGFVISIVMIFTLR
jgi:V/A-type H+-transporting ATPase subunit K